MCQDFSDEPPSVPPNSQLDPGLQAELGSGEALITSTPARALAMSNCSSQTNSTSSRA